MEEYIDGITVAEVMQVGKYRYWGAKKVLQGICSALTVLHSRGIIHKCTALNPANRYQSAKELAAKL